MKSYHQRTDCPYCGGHNSFSITKENGLVKFHCFRVSCNKQGIVQENRSVEDMKNIHRPKPHVAKFITTSRPVTWIPAENTPVCMEWLQRYGCMYAYKYHKDKFYYDTALDRLVFIEYHNKTNAVVFAIGRSMHNNKLKWWKYSQFMQSKLFTIDNCAGLRVFIVEDAASACALSAFGVGVSINGTAFPAEEFIHKFYMYKNYPVYVCLDQDATQKGMYIKRNLEGLGFNCVKLKVFSDDPKYLNVQQISKELGEV